MQSIDKQNYFRGTLAAACWESVHNRKQLVYIWTWRFSVKRFACDMTSPRLEQQKTKTTKLLINTLLTVNRPF